ncbi:copper resistance protein CopC [Geomicrobium sp. JCM 19039]|uniref:copper resistance CopC family protein n=1 Tax=Geomicrobium sp. JCM 19039 TaxID=1460636 RepID=UPI00045F4C27|nr:copper resistance protein CopC [Geomicrobium sp. JCM 19039]GAK12675.1 copper resistance protein CopC [Geomicrobium sp. JCM 19039]
MKSFKATFVAVLLVFGLVSLSSQTLAHSYVDTSTPEDGETVEETVDTITMHFDAGIEPATTAVVTDADGNEYTIGSEEFEGDDFIVHLDEPLPSGDYTVAWQALGADGHGTEGEFNFTVDAQEEEEVVEEEEPEVIEEEEADLEVEESAETDVEDEETDQNSGLVIAIVVAVLVVGFAVFFMSRRNKS